MSMSARWVILDRSARRRFIGRVGLAAVATLIGFRLVLCFVPPYQTELLRYQASTSVLDRHGIELRTTLGPGDTLCKPVKLSETGHWTTRALIALEDKRFYSHNGIDRIAICRAILQNLKARRVVSGASTLSTLVVKLTDPRPRNIWTKIVEARHAAQLEKAVGKNEILEQYLNRAPFGGNIRGIEAASRHYFNKPAMELSLSESAMLAAIPQKPERVRPDLWPQAATARRNIVLRRMKTCGYITDKQYRAAVAEGVVLCRGSMPFQAPHFCDMILKRSTAGSGKIVTTLDLELQATAEAALRDKLAALVDRNVRGGAIVVIDVKAAAIRAMAGSPDFGNAAAGQVNAAIAPRSPGSALKPFIYAMALDQGICSPQTVLADIPVNYASYRPANFDLAFRGPVTLTDALVSSLNIPAMTMTQKVGLDNTVDTLRRLGISTLNEAASRYGVSIAIGTCEVTLLDLANAYACLAREGQYMPVRMTDEAMSGKYETQEESKGDKSLQSPECQSSRCTLSKAVTPAGTRLFSKETSFMVADMLSGDARQFDVAGHVADTIRARVAWKTGTSSGRRDALAVAWNPDYVVAVWLGNPDGSALGDVKGNDAAITAHTVFRRIYPDGHGPWFERPAGLSVRQICSRSGNMPNDNCPTTVAADYIPGITASDRCSIHKISTGNPAQIAEVWPTGLGQFLAKGGMLSASSLKAAAINRADTAVRIKAPDNKQEFRLIEDVPQLKQEVGLSAATASATGQLYWFIDNELYSVARNDQTVFWALKRGNHTIACSTTAGESDHIAITVE